MGLRCDRQVGVGQERRGSMLQLADRIRKGEGTCSKKREVEIAVEATKMRRKSTTNK